MAFDPSTATLAFDPLSATPVDTQQFDPSTATPVASQDAQGSIQTGDAAGDAYMKRVAKLNKKPPESLPPSEMARTGMTKEEPGAVTGGTEQDPINQQGLVPPGLIQAGYKASPLYWAGKLVAPKQTEDISKGLSESVAGFTSPNNLALLATAPLMPEGIAGKVAGTALGAYFEAQQIKADSAEVAELRDAYAKGDLKTVTKVVSELGIGHVLPLLAALHADANPAKPETPPPQEEVTPQGQAIPQWAREEMLRRGLNPGRTFNDVDLANPSVQQAIKLDPTLSDAQKQSLLSTGSTKPEAPPIQRVSPETGQTFYDYEGRNEPPAQTVRLYHGSRSGTQVGDNFTPDLKYAEGWISQEPHGKVYYVDVPEDAPFLQKDDINLLRGKPRLITKQVLPEELVKQAKPVPESGQTPPVATEEPAVTPQKPTPEPQTPQDVVGSDVDSRPVETTTGVANRVLESEAQAGKIGEVEPGEGMSWQEMVDRGRDLLNKGADPQMIARRLGRTGRISPDDFAVLRAERERLNLETTKAEQVVRDNPNDPQAQNIYNQARATETNWIRNVVQPVKTATSDIFRGMQGEAPVDTSTFAGLRRAVLDQKGRDVAPKEVAPLETRARKVQEAQQAESQAVQKLGMQIDRSTAKVRLRSVDELKAEMAKMAEELLPCK